MGNYQESYPNMLENWGKHARKMILKNKGYLGGPPLKSAIIAGSTIPVTRVSNGKGGWADLIL